MKGLRLYVIFATTLFSMELIPLIADYWKMDGGVAFGVVPKTLWTKAYPEDQDNLIRIVTRCLLIKSGSSVILIDAGMGDKRDEKYYNWKYRFGSSGIAEALLRVGTLPGEVTDVLFTHLHDDHVGGATYTNDEGCICEVFPNATYWCSETHWNWAQNSNVRESAAYFSDNLDPLEKSGRLRLIAREGEWLAEIRLRMFNGHTRGQVVPVIPVGETKVVFTADFIGSKANIPVHYIPAVDIDPLTSMIEKEAFLAEAADNRYILMFEHDYYCEACFIERTGNGYAAGKELKLNELNLNS